jgi:hypothetical protein
MTTKKIKSRENDQYLVVDSESGEVIGTIGYGDHIVRKEQLQHLKQQALYEPFNEGRNFVKVFDGALPLLADKLTAGELAFVIKLLPFISYNDGILRNKNRSATQLKDLAQYMKLSHEGVRKVVVSLISKGVLGEHRTGSVDKPNVIHKCITVNPYIFMRGNKMNKTIIGLFEKTDWNTNGSLKE